MTRSGMAIHVGQRFLNDAEDRGFQLRLAAGQVGRIDFEFRSQFRCASSDPSRYQRSAETRPTSSSSGGCRRWEMVRTCWMARSISVAGFRHGRFAGCGRRFLAENCRPGSSWPQPAPVPVHREFRGRMRRRSSSCRVISRLESRRSSAVRSSTILSNSIALSRIDCSSILLSWMSEQVPYHLRMLPSGSRSGTARARNQRYFPSLAAHPVFGFIVSHRICTQCTQCARLSVAVLGMQILQPAEADRRTAAAPVYS